MDLTVIIPTRNRAEMLDGLLGSLAEQRARDLDWEVLVIDNGSTDDTESVVRDRGRSFPARLRCLREDTPGLHRGRNRGLIEAKGAALGFLDDDMTLGPDWTGAARHILEGRAQAVAGKIVPEWRGEIPEWMAILEEKDLLGYLGLLDYGDETRPIPPYLIPGGNSFLCRKTALACRGFNPDGMPAEHLRLRGDGETGFYKSFQEKGYVSLYEPTALARHVITANRLTVEYICERAYRQGISDSYTEIRRAGGLELPFLEQIREAYHQGRLFHRGEVRRDPKLLQWVLKEHYLDD